MQRWDRFDMRIKAAYARHANPVPFAVAAYTEHARLCNRSGPPWDWRFFKARGYISSAMDWAVHDAIVTDGGLHVLHIWPRAVARGDAVLAQARALAASRCAIDGGILYEKRVPVSEQALRSYLEMA